MKSKKKRPFVYYDTIWKSVGGGFSNPGETKVSKVGKYNVLLSRSERLDKYGNPIHTASLLDSNGSVKSSYRGNGSATWIVSSLLKKNGVDTKKRKIYKK